MDFSIVIAVKDDPVGLSKTINSLQEIINDINLIIVTPSDGSATNRLAKHLEGSIENLKLVVDEGLGIYPAMNAGLFSVTDWSWTWFLNANDELHSPESFYKVKRSLALNPSEVYWSYSGFALYDSDDGYIEKRAAPNFFSKQNQLFARNFISHQAVVAKASFLKKLEGFNPTYKIAADWDLICRMNDRAAPLRIDTILANFKLGGYSSNFRNQGNKELLKLRKEHLKSKKQFYSIVWFTYRVIRNTIVETLEHYSPNFVKRMRKLRSRVRKALVN